MSGAGFFEQAFFVEGRNVDRVEDIQEGMTVARGLRKALIETTAAAAADLRPDAVEDLAVFFVFIETLIHEGAEKAAALRDAEGDAALEVVVLIAEQGFRAAVLEERGEVTHGGGAETGDDGIFCEIDNFVDPSGRESAFHLNLVFQRSWIAAAAGVGPGIAKRPLVARNECARAVDGIADVHFVFRRIRVSRGVANLCAVSQADGFHALIARPLRDNQARDGLAVLFGDRDREMEKIRARGNIELPADPDERVALLEQKAIAKGLGRVDVERATGEIEGAQEAFAAAVRNLKQCRAVAFSGIARLEDEEIGFELDKTGSVDRSQIQVGNDAARGEFGVDGELHPSLNGLIRAGGAKGLTVQNVLPLDDVNFIHGGEQRMGKCGKKGEAKE